MSLEVTSFLAVASCGNTTEVNVLAFFGFINLLDLIIEAKAQADTIVGGVSLTL